MRPEGCSREQPGESGAALLAALLTVVLVATVASAGLWRQWTAIEVERAERERAQAAWILRGAIDWARLILREDARAGRHDHLGEPWAVPLQEARLGSFLAAEAGGATAGAFVDEAFLSGEITDLQSRLNLRNLLDARGEPSPSAARSFERLFVQLGLPVAQLETLVSRWQEGVRAQQASSASPSTATASITSHTAPDTAPLLPTHEDQLGWLGLSESTVQALRPHVCVLPSPTTVNLNTASPIVLRAVTEGLDAAQAQRLVTARSASPWKTLDEAQRVLGTSGTAWDPSEAGVDSRYFRIRATLRQATHTLQEETRVLRERDTVRVLERIHASLPEQRHRAEFYAGP